MRTGRRRPRRSEKRPSSGLTTTSIRPATRKTAPIANGAKPPSSSRSGTSTTSIPKSQAGRVFSQSPPRKLRSVRARRTASGACPSGAAVGRVAAQTASAAATAPTLVNATRTLTASATAPNMGPRMAPKTAAPKAVPISSPRRSRGVATVSQANAPAQVIVLEAPWTKRASPSAQGPFGSGEREARRSEQDRGRRRPRPSGPSAWPRARRECRRAALRRRRRRRAVRRRSSRARTRPRSREPAARAPRTASRRRTRPRTRERGAGASADVTDRLSRSVGQRAKALANEPSGQAR